MGENVPDISSPNAVSSWVERHFGWLLYLAYFFAGLILLYQCRSQGLLPYPQAGMDQLTILETGKNLVHGILPNARDYMYSPNYTVYLALLSIPSGANILIMRILQLATVSLIPPLIYHTALELKFSRDAAIFGGILYLFYGAGLLISLDFLRAAPLALCYLFLLYSLLRAARKESREWYFAAGLIGANCILGRETLAFPVLLLLPFLCWKSGKFHWKEPLLYLVGILIPILPLMSFNAYRAGTFAIVPGHIINVIGCYHGEAGTRDQWGALWTMFLQTPGNLFDFLSSYEIPNSLSFHAHRTLTGILKVTIIPFHLLFYFALVGWFRKGRNYGGLLGFVLIAGAAAVLVWFPLYYRFRIPIVPLLALFAGAGLEDIREICRNKRWLLLTILLAGALIWQLIFYQNPEQRQMPQERRATTTLLIHLDRLEEAETALEACRRDRILTRDLENLLLDKYCKSENLDYARKLYLRWYGAPPGKSSSDPKGGKAGNQSSSSVNEAR